MTRQTRGNKVSCPKPSIWIAEDENDNRAQAHSEPNFAALGREVEGINFAEKPKGAFCL